MKTTSVYTSEPQPQGCLRRVGPDLFALCVYACLCLASLVFLIGARPGTRVEGGYVFGSNDGSGNFVTVVVPKTVFVAEYFVPAYTFVGVIAHLLALVYSESKHFTITAVQNALMLPLMIGQLALLARVNDLEKILLLMFGAFGATVMGSLARHQQQSGVASAPRDDMLAWVCSSAVWAAVWIVLWTNMAWQVNHSNSPSYAFAAFFIVSAFFIALILYTDVCGMGLCYRPMGAHAHTPASDRAEGEPPSKHVRTGGTENSDTVPRVLGFIVPMASCTLLTLVAFAS